MLIISVNNFKIIKNDENIIRPNYIFKISYIEQKGKSRFYSVQPTSNSKEYILSYWNFYSICKKAEKKNINPFVELNQIEKNWKNNLKVKRL